MGIYWKWWETIVIKSEGMGSGVMVAYIVVFEGLGFSRRVKLAVDIDVMNDCNIGTDA